MKEIPLTQGKFTTVSDEDYDWLNQWKWCAVKGHNTFYAMRANNSSGMRSGLKMHRLILGLTDPKISVDHIDGNGLNNQRNNLRACTHQQNSMNRQATKNGASKFKGVSWFSETQKWVASLRHNKKYYHLGYFDNEIDAAKAYNDKAIEMHGDFARINAIADYKEMQL